MALGSKLKQLLNDRNITVKDFAESIGVPPTTIYSFIKRDSTTGKLELINKIATGLNMSMENFLENDDIKIFNKHVKEVGEAMGLPEEKASTIAAHFDGDEYTEEELEEIKKFAEFVKSKRKEHE